MSKLILLWGQKCDGKADLINVILIEECVYLRDVLDSLFRVNLVVDYKARLHLSKFLKKKKRNFKEELLSARGQVWNMLWERRSVAGLFLLRSNLNHFLTGTSQQNNKQTIKYTKYIQSKFIRIFLSKKQQNVIGDMFS